MTKAKNTKRALLLSVLSMMLCAAMFVSSTFAWFTDSASANVNTIKSGTLKVELQDKDGVSLEGRPLNWQTADGRAQEAILWEPGCTYDLDQFKIVNKGTLAIKYKVVITGIQGDAPLNEAITWTMNGADGTALALGTELHLAASSETALYTISGHMKETAGNEYQGLAIENISITVIATQDTVEHDSFDDQYDKDIPLTWVSTEAELTAKLNKGEPVLLTDDIVLDSLIDFIDNATVDGNGKTLSSTVTGARAAIGFGYGLKNENTVWNLNNIHVETGSDYGAIAYQGDADNSTINFNSVSLKAKSYGIQTQNPGKTTNLNVNDSVIESWGALVTKTKVNAAFNNSHLIGINPYSTPTNEYAVVDISYFGTDYTSEGSVFDFNGCTLEAREDGTETQRFMIVRKGCTITLDECTFIKNGEEIPAEKIMEDFNYDEATGTYCNSYIRIYEDVIGQVSLLIDGNQVNPHYNTAD